MSRALDLVATAAALGIFGYFVYKVILPKLPDLQLPSFQFTPPPTQIQQPAAAPIQYQQPATAPPTQQQQPQQKQKDQEDDSGGEEESAAPANETPQSAIAPPPPIGNVIYDSTKGWSGVKTAASGNPKWTTAAGGVGTLSCGSGHCRVYISVKNYNARMEGEYMYNGAVDNFSLRLRSRHQEGGACENRFGGFGASIDRNGEVGFKTESCHNEHENSIKGKVTPPQPNKWYKFAYSCYDSPDKKSVNFKLEFDGKTVLTGKHASPQPYYVNEALHRQNSYIWLRSNNSGQGTISFRNFRVTSIGTSGAAANVALTRRLMIDEPYLFNGYYNRRRL